MTSVRSAAAALLALAAIINAQIKLQSLSFFSILGNTAITNTGATTVDGNIGIFPNNVVEGFPPGVVHDGAIYKIGPKTGQAKDDLVVAFILASSLRPTATVPTELGNTAYGPGVYLIGESGNASLNGTLTLHTDDPNKIWVFQMRNSLAIGNNARVVLANGSASCNVFWKVGGVVRMGTSVDVSGIFLSVGSIHVGSGGTINGGLYTLNDQVSLDSDTIHRCVPPPSTTSTAATNLDAATPPPPEATTTSTTARDAATTADPSATADAPATDATSMDTTTAHVTTSAASTDGTGAVAATTSTTATASTTDAETRCTGGTTASKATPPATRGGRGDRVVATTVITFTVTCPVAPTVITSCGQTFYITSPGATVLRATSTATLQNAPACKECATSPPYRGTAIGMRCPACTSRGPLGSKTGQAADGRPHSSRRIGPPDPSDVTAAASSTASLRVCDILAVVLVLSATFF
ncbi:hypothetical protein DCS_07055 [Drechmeria coniospora]|uniref:Uncharacterized protein n=1 Tax=Drechmeria coniospora TaxID=98403 RepID=A0A151GDG1_DRECN|nr:hypothetical protein DCS_07055 [Drechmeria coniospora]KYK55093.1 hypothetical protein DCS_07055 [Drechmeria coniospora]ODA82282.1 hypothetical protein RJ55_00789 [Drechmeria coniospora]